VEESEIERTSSHISRREALARAAKFGGALAWTMPFVQSVDIRAAAALTGSPGPADETGRGSDGSNDDGGSSGASGGTGDGSGSGGGSGGGGGGRVDGTTTTALQILGLKATPNPLRLNGNRRLRTSFFVSAGAMVQVTIVRGDRVIRRLPPRTLDAAGSVSTRWNGRSQRGKDVPAGRYSIVVQAVDGLGGLAEATLRVRVTS
jgi:FlgD Ig-like domain